LHIPLTASRLSVLALLAAAACVLAAVYLPILTNPGYFSHDELQWGRMATAGGFADIPWLTAGPVETFQWRPLTFNLWLWLSWLAYRDPMAMHAIWAVLGAVDALLLFFVLRRLSASRATAFVAAIAFAASPYAVYVHGWVATLADLLWVGAAAAGAWFVLTRRPDEVRAPAIAGVAAAGVGLLSKEAAIVVLPLALLAWWLSGFERRWLGAWAGCSVPVCLYLVVRLPVILYGERVGGAYAWSLADIPARWYEAHVWTFLVKTFEPNNVPLLPWRSLRVAILMALMLTATLFRASPRLGIAYLVGGAVAIGPALLLDASSPQYGYAFAAWSAGSVALAWARLGRAGKAVVLLALLGSTWHGLLVAQKQHHVGQLESRFSATLEPALAGSAGSPLRLWVANADEAWVYARLVHGIPDAGGAVFVAQRSQAALIVRADGVVVPRTGD
jgi:hypothetical protein